MEYAPNGTLYDLLHPEDEKKFKPVTPGLASYLFAQLALGIEHLHSNNVMHKDLKPQNIFAFDHNIIKIGDFGTAKHFKNTVIIESIFTGTKGYMAPEVASG